LAGGARDSRGAVGGVRRPQTDMPEGVSGVRAELERIGLERTRLRLANDQLLQDTVRAIRAAQGQVPMGEAAQLAGVARSTAYRVIGARGDDDDGCQRGKQ
jgi:hypothetical protein